MYEFKFSHGKVILNIYFCWIYRLKVVVTKNTLENKWPKKYCVISLYVYILYIHLYQSLWLFDKLLFIWFSWKINHYDTISESLYINSMKNSFFQTCVISFPVRKNTIPLNVDFQQNTFYSYYSPYKISIHVKSRKLNQ